MIKLKIYNIVFYTSIFISFIAFTFSLANKKKSPNKLNYWFNIALIFISIAMLTLNVVIFSIDDYFYNVVNLLLRKRKIHPT